MDLTIVHGFHYYLSLWDSICILEHPPGITSLFSLLSKTSRARHEQDMFWAVAAVILALCALRCWLGLLRHRRLSRKIGLNSIEFPIPEFNPLYMATYQTPLIPYIANKWLPRGIAEYIYNSTLRYRWRVKDRVCRKYGRVYLFTTPGSVSCHVSDASVAWQIFKTRQSFPKLVKQYGM